MLLGILWVLCAEIRAAPCIVTVVLCLGEKTGSPSYPFLANQWNFCVLQNTGLIFRYYSPVRKLKEFSRATAQLSTYTKGRERCSSSYQQRQLSIGMLVPNWLCALLKPYISLKKKKKLISGSRAGNALSLLMISSPHMIKIVHLKGQPCPHNWKAQPK